MLEKRFEPVICFSKFLLRLICFSLFACLLVSLGLAIGMIGYHHFEPNMSWIDAFHNAALILSDMGPVTEMSTPAGRIFLGLYALFSGLAFIAISSIVLTPIIHRMVHKFHSAPDR